MSTLICFLNPRKYRRDQHAARVAALKLRDGEHCARCRRPIRFDFPAGHDQGPVIEPASSEASPNDVRLCHRRCNAPGIDHTVEVAERVRRKNEAALFGKSRKRRAA